ncbi:MAG: 1-(5-phosphoribosyl)-5-[(5-phosphoribosylamino)methylideneamino]imidazole-4-carboxamide isomerase [Anaerolineae bacterium]|nr:1-(5-phosphoribosyl)-5-[(5-phosphoribosylamino)methylideneamino]imidazole-4-carboxamide isomerase [Anaerolineae bacterium]
MIVYPAIDLRRGRCVRLRQGEPTEETVYGDDPVACARRWEQAGAEWLHIVNLDGALVGALQYRLDAELPVNLRCLRDIAAAVEIPIQFGGGVRTLSDVEVLLHLGATRAILGTVAVRHPELVSAAIERFGPQHIAVGLDAREGMILTHGWQQTSHVVAIDLAREMSQRGVETVIYTDTSRDGMLSGINVSATVTLAMQTGLRVIASGGLASLSDIDALLEVETTGIEGVIVGRALYTGAIELEQAIAAARHVRC